MSAAQRQPGIRDFYVETVLPALAAHLDTAFPEFGWRRDRHGWVATNQEMTHRVLGVRADRVVAHGEAPAGFLIYGGDSTPWTAYVNGGIVPHGPNFADVVDDLARRAGVAHGLTEHGGQGGDPRRDLLEVYFDTCQAELRSPGGARAREYLDSRGLQAEKAGLGLVPSRATAVDVLRAAGFTDGDVTASGVLADRRWHDRVVGAWRNERGRIGTMWARSIDPFADSDSKYLYLKGTSRTQLPPYGLGDLHADPAAARREVLLVEGLLDVHQLRARGMRPVAAIGGTSAPPGLFERLTRSGVEELVLAFDNDEAGRTATAKAVEAASRAKTSPSIRVLDPVHLGEAKDPDAFVRDHGIQAFQRLLADTEPAVTWRANELVISADHGPTTRQTALARAGRWLGTLPPRLALEQEDAVKVVANRCGYSTEATIRAFQARFWPDPTPQRADQQRSLDLSLSGP